MGGQQERICPTCMEEMDLTDQELQPCICGYEICLWCWHFIIQTAAKDGSDARCPACHSPYDMEKILKRTISKERLEIVNAHKKHKLQKAKRRLTDLGKDLNGIRVIRRNIVYIAGIPKKISNEKTLRKKEYLGQYGKIVKICFAQTDVSRQYYSWDSCIVYATFSMEEEALRCIQVVNGYILDGKPLKASFGTTRYCYSWLNNLPCKNPDCLYVHDVVPQEDICSREEVISFCTSKLQQCSRLPYTNLEQHSGSFFPPPLDTKNLPAPLGFINNNRYMQSDYFGRSYATVASSHNQSKLFDTNDNLLMPSSRAEVYFSSSTGDHNHVSSSVPTSSNSGPDFEFSHIDNKTRDKKSLNQLHSDLGSAKFNYSLEDESLSISLGKKSNDFSTFSTLATNLYHEFDEPSALLPTEPMVFHGEQRDSRDKVLSNSGRNFEFPPADKARDEKFLIESYIEDCEDRILSNIFALDLDAIDDSGDTFSVLEQLGSSDDLSGMSNSSLPFHRDDSKSYFSEMDDMYVAIGQLSSWSNGASGLTNNSSCSEIMIKKEAYMEDFLNKFYLETSETSKVLNNTSLLPATMVVSNSRNSLDMHHSGSSLSQPISEHPFSNSTRRTTLSTPPGFPPRKTNPGFTTQSQPHSTDSAGFVPTFLR